MKWWQYITCMFESPDRETRKLLKDFKWWYRHGATPCFLPASFYLDNRIKNASKMHDDFYSGINIKERDGKMTIAEKIKVMQADADGKVVEFKRKNEPDSQYSIYIGGAATFAWNWEDYDYRIKPESPRSHPFDFGSFPFPCVIKHDRFTNAEALVLAKGLNYIVVSGIGIPNTISYAELTDYKWRPLNGVVIPQTGKAEGETIYIWKPCTKELLG